MGKLRHGAAHRIRVGALDNLIQFGQAKTADHRFVRLRGRNEASIVLNLNLALTNRFLCLCLTWHNTSQSFETNSVTVRPTTYPQLVYHGDAPIPSDLSCEAARRKLLAQRYAD